MNVNYRHSECTADFNLIKTLITLLALSLHQSSAEMVKLEKSIMISTKKEKWDVFKYFYLL